jgi:pyruvate,water dikinase
MAQVLHFSDMTMSDVPIVGGKNASLGEMTRELGKLGVRVPEGFATTAQAFRDYLDYNNLTDAIARTIEGLDVDDVAELTRVGAKIRTMIGAGSLPPQFEEEIRAAYQTLAAKTPDASVLSFAVRSSATAEDLPEASFAGQQETFLNVQGIDNVLDAIRAVFASLYNDRAISYRTHHGFAHGDVAISAAVQRMIRSDLASSGVMFTIDTETGFDQALFITSAYGLGEAVVQGAVNPDEFYVYKPGLAAHKHAILKKTLGQKALKMMYTSDASLGKTIEFVDVPAQEQHSFSITDAEAQELARHGMTIEGHYGRPMDIEWGKDGEDGLLYILQARPETVASRRTASFLQKYTLNQSGTVLIEGRAIGQKIGAGPVTVLDHIDDMVDFQPGSVLVADMTDPDWEPIMKRAAAIVTNRGGRTCHAAIIARELGIPAVVGSGNATEVLTSGQGVTVSCAEGEAGLIYEGILDFSVEETATHTDTQLPTKIMMNVGTPDQAFAFSMIPNDGVGLARLEFIINREIGIHPLALLDPHSQPEDVQAIIEKRTWGFDSPRDFFVKKLASGIATLGAAFAPNPVIVRMSDFKSNEYANLVGGKAHEPEEENPMIGFRGASRYISESFKPAFEMECEALKFVRDDMGLTNVEIMIPFVRTVPEAAAVIEALADNGLVRAENGLRVIMMCEIPSNVILADEFLEHFDGFSIGSNDLTQLTLGLDRDSGIVAGAFDERDPAVQALMAQAIAACKARDKYIGICGQGPSDHPDLAEWLVAQGIDSLSLNPDSVMGVRTLLSKHSA